MHRRQAILQGCRERAASLHREVVGAAGYITQTHGRPDEGVHAIQLEINRDLYMDERALSYEEARAARVTEALEPLSAALQSFSPTARAV